MPISLSSDSVVEGKSGKNIPDKSRVDWKIIFEHSALSTVDENTF